MFYADFCVRKNMQARLGKSRNRKTKIVIDVILITRAVSMNRR